MVDDMRNSISDKGFKPSWVTIQPIDDNRTITPGEGVTHWNVEYFLHVI